MENYESIRLPWHDWHIVRRLGSGGFGNVYEIERELYGEKERAAMKVINLPQKASELEEDYNSGMTEKEIWEKYAYIQKCMVEEYRQMLEFKGHSNIVNCHDFSVLPNPHQPGCTIYIRMELLTPLKEVLSKEKFSESSIIQVGTDICKALEMCEKKDIIHRDIKPDNIMMSEFGSFKLGDFGLARTMEKTMSASLAGTDWYMAPEVAKKMKYGKSVDTYSLGLVLYWLLNQYRLPFVPLKERITTKDMDNAYRLRMQGKEIPEPAEGSQRLKEIVLKAISYDRDRRYHCAKEMLDALRSVYAGSASGYSSYMDARQQQKSDFLQQAETAKGIFGIYFGYDELQVRLWIGGATRPVLKMPAIYIKDVLGDLLTGIRAQNYLKCHKEESEKNQDSVLAAMRGADNSSDIAVKESAEETCCALMKELKRNLDRTPYGKIRECVIAVPVSSLMIRKSIDKAMQEAGFQVERQLNTAVACAVSKAYLMKQDQQFMVCTSASGEWQYVTADYEAGVLEIVENVTALPGYDQTGTNRRLLKYYVGDCAFRSRYQEDAAGYEELAAVAADGAAIQGTKLSGALKKDFLLLDVFPLRAGLEVVDADNRVCFPLTWMIEEQTTIPTKSAAVPVCVNSGIKGKKLRMYTGNAGLSETFKTGKAHQVYRGKPGTNETARMVREWDLEKMCRGSVEDPKRLEAVLHVGLGLICQPISVEIRKTGTGEKVITLDFSQYDQQKTSGVSLTTTYVPKQILQEVCKAEELFQKDVRMLEYMYKNHAIVQGIHMIAKQSAEIFDCYTRKDIDVRIDTFIEQMLAIADNLEYGLKETAKMKCTDEEVHLCFAGRSVLLPFYTIIRDNLFRLNLIPVEAEGVRFDPYVHHAMAAERVEGVEEDMITEEIQKGYFRGEKLFRPARVKVAE